MLQKANNFRMFPNLLDEFFNDDFWRSRNLNSTALVNVKESGDSFDLELAAPGMSRDDFKINLDNRVLTISTEKKSENEDKDDGYLRKEFGHYSFSRSFTLPDTVNEDEISAKYEEGILHVNLPKREEIVVKPKQIEIH